MVQFLNKVSIFSNLKEDKLKALESCLIKRRYAKGQIIFHKGDESGGLYIISSGKVKVYIPSTQGEEVILAILAKGEIIGELSLLDGTKRSATISVTEDSEVMYLSRNDFLNFLRSDFDTVLNLFSMITKRLRNTNDQLEEAYMLDITSRIARKILALAEQFGVEHEGNVRIGVKITQKDLAAMIGATRESVNKQLNLLKKNGLVNMENGYITILNTDRLTRRARTSL